MPVIEPSRTIAVPENMIERRWVCQVARSGYHNGSRCTPNDPHGDWGCEYRHEFSLTDAEFGKLSVT